MSGKNGRGSEQQGLVRPEGPSPGSGAGKAGEMPPGDDLHRALEQLIRRQDDGER